MMEEGAVCLEEFDNEIIQPTIIEENESSNIPVVIMKPLSIKETTNPIQKVKQKEINDDMPLEEVFDEIDMNINKELSTNENSQEEEKSMDLQEKLISKDLINPKINTTLSLNDTLKYQVPIFQHSPKNEI